MKQSIREILRCLLCRTEPLERRFPQPGVLNVLGIEYREGTGWPLAADLPEGTGIVWWNSTATAARLYINQAGNLHYTSFTT